MRGKQLVVVCVLLFGLVLWTFLPAIHNGFVNYDDDVYVTGNAHVQGGLNPAGIVWAFKSTDASNWHPLTWLSHMADCSLYGLNPEGHHFTNVLLHALNTVLLFLVLRQMTGAGWRSLFVAAVFGLHPLRVESVAWVAERKDVLSAFFGLLTLICYTSYAQQFKIQNSKFKIFYALSLFFFALGLMSKPMLVTWPLVLLLLDWWPLKRITNYELRIANCEWWPLQRIDLVTCHSPLVTIKHLLLEKIPFLALAAASCVVTYLAQKHGGAMVLMAGQSFPARLENAVVSYGRYLGKLFWPKNLAVVYPVVNHWPFLLVAGISILLAMASAAALVLRRTRPYLMTGWFWYLGTLVPVLGLVAVGEQAMADRYTYFPTIGVLLIIAWSMEELTRRWRQRTIALSVASLILLVACIVATRQNIAYWKNSETLFRHVIAATKDNYSAHCNLANALVTQGDLEGALIEYQTALRLKPESFENQSNVGMALAYLNRIDEAILAFQNALKLNPGFGMGHQNLGMAYEAKNRLDDAIREYEEAVRLMPNYAPAHNCLGVALAKQGNLDEALAQFQIAVRLDPSFVPAQKNLKMALDLKAH